MGRSRARSYPCVDLWRLINLRLAALLFGGCLVTSRRNPVSPRSAAAGVAAAGERSGAERARAFSA